MAYNTILYVGNRCKVFPREGVRDSRLQQQVSPWAPFFVDVPPSGGALPGGVLGYGPGGMGRNVICQVSDGIARYR